MTTHERFQTISHHHLDFNYRDPDGTLNYPRSALMIVECSNGRWFVEQDFGTEYDRFPGILKSRRDLLTHPIFYADDEEAATAAFVLIKQAYPTTPDEFLLEFLRS